ncbi:hypothetical protein [Chitinophaga sedimenti]
MNIAGSPLAQKACDAPILPGVTPGVTVTVITLLFASAHPLELTTLRK